MVDQKKTSRSDAPIESWEITQKCLDNGLEPSFALLQNYLSGRYLETGRACLNVINIHYVQNEEPIFFTQFSKAMRKRGFPPSTFRKVLRKLEKSGFVKQEDKSLFKPLKRKSGKKKKIRKKTNTSENYFAGYWKLTIDTYINHHENFADLARTVRDELERKNKESEGGKTERH